MNELTCLANLIKQRNSVAAEIAEIIGRPALIGHVGEFVASKVFDIELQESATQKGFDGRFNAGPLAGSTVNIKFYGKHEGILDINPNEVPDYYFVLTGPKTPASSSRGSVRPWVIECVFLLNAEILIPELQATGKKIGTAASVRKDQWLAAEIYPKAENQEYLLSEEQRRLLNLFGGE